MLKQIQQTPGTLFIISGPSGAGKTTVLRQALAHLQPSVPLEAAVTYTTKSPRPGDVFGVDYHFVSQEEFERKIAEGFFVEYSTSYGAHYGTPVSLLESLRQGISLIAVLDYNGVKAFMQAYHAVVPIWLGALHQSVLEQRLASRATESDEQVKFRLERFQQEELEEKSLRLFQYYLINNDLAETVKQLTSLIRYELSRAVVKNVDN